MISEWNVVQTAGNHFWYRQNKYPTKKGSWNQIDAFQTEIVFNRCQWLAVVFSRWWLGKLVREAEGSQQESNRWCSDSLLLCSTRICRLLSFSHEMAQKVVRLSIDNIELIVKRTDLPFFSSPSNSLFTLRVCALEILPSTDIMATCHAVS